jgi:hypothetical protein
MTVWERRDLPLLRTLAAGEDEQIRAGYLHIGHSNVGERLGLELDDYAIHDGFACLGDAGYSTPASNIPPDPVQPSRVCASPVQASKLSVSGHSSTKSPRRKRSPSSSSAKRRRRQRRKKRRTCVGRRATFERSEPWRSARRSRARFRRPRALR